ncbi:MATE family efflux transporter [Flocculibacter collagenilyticus]|uniref:hypothetical protein n=1 Tax=Flocculibacter collagenilyticus TaxID=2744479 RepID=UPI0018F43B93|nr:hypothetical protein [Flocculibacter collagenilyticus]
MTTMVLFIAGSASAKALPIIVGAVTALKLSSLDYSIFISFLLLANLLSSVSVLGCTPQIISLNEPHAHSQFNEILTSGLTCFTLACLISLGVYYLLPNAIVGFNNFSPFVVIIYSLGQFFIHAFTSKLNNKQRHTEASMAWLTFAVLSLINLTVWYFLLDTLKQLLILLSICSVASGVVAYVILSKSEESIFLNLNCFKFKWGTLGNTCLISIFGLSISGVLFFLQNNVLKYNAVDGATFSFMYQIFSLIIFIPSVLGGIVVPKLIRTGHSNMVYLYYIIIAVILTQTFLLAYPQVASYFNLPSFEAIKHELLVFTIVCILSSTNAFSNQQIVASKNFFVLTKFALIFATTALVTFLLNPPSLLSAWTALGIAYIFGSIYMCTNIYFRGKLREQHR